MSGGCPHGRGSPFLLYSAALLAEREAQEKLDAELAAALHEQSVREYEKVSPLSKNTPNQTFS